MQRRKRSPFAKMRNVKNPEWAVAAPPGGLGIFPFNYTEQQNVHAYSFARAVPSVLLQAAYLFAIHPGEDGDGIRYMHGLEDDGDNKVRYRMCGIDGDIYWRPVEAPDVVRTDKPGLWSGYIHGGWVKVTEDGGHAEPILRRFPWKNWSQAQAMAEGRARQFFAYPNWPTAAEIAANDPRIIRSQKLIGEFHLPWVARNDMMQQGAGLAAEFWPGNAVKIPIPRKLVCNVGRDEALAFVYSVSDNSQLGSAPQGEFTFPTLRFKMHKLD